MPQCFVCSEAKCAHRWEPTGHQMTCCGVGGVVCFGAKRQRGEKRREQEHWAPDAPLKFTQSWWDATMLRPGLILSTRTVNREAMSQMCLVLCFTVNNWLTTVSIITG